MEKERFWKRTRPSIDFERFSHVITSSPSFGPGGMMMVPALCSPPCAPSFRESILESLACISNHHQKHGIETWRWTQSERARERDLVEGLFGLLGGEDPFEFLLQVAFLGTKRPVLHLNASHLGLKPL